MHQKYELRTELRQHRFETDFNFLSMSNRHCSKIAEAAFYESPDLSQVMRWAEKSGAVAGTMKYVYPVGWMPFRDF
jgi:hypothetical protein